jgi:Rieske Fe-S protein
LPQLRSRAEVDSQAVRKGTRAIVAIAGVAVVLIFTTLVWEGLRRDQQAVVVAKLSDLTATPLPVGAPEIDGVEYSARQQRFGGVNYLRLPFSVHPNPTALFLVRDVAGRVRAFIAVDPISGCGLRWEPARTVFSDPCRGALYNEDGAVVGGPGFWELDQVEVTIREDSVLVYPSRVLLGGCADRNQC